MNSFGVKIIEEVFEEHINLKANPWPIHVLILL